MKEKIGKRIVEASQHENGCPLRRPYLYDPDEGPLECKCADLRAGTGKKNKKRR